MTTEPTTPPPDLDTTVPLMDLQTPPTNAAPMASAPQPRTRWAAIIWGACFAAIAWFGIWMLSGDARRGDVSDWFFSLSPATATAILLLSVGVLVLVAGSVGLIRHGQRRRTAEH